jgi:hypothetical protein
MALFYPTKALFLLLPCLHLPVLELALALALALELVLKPVLELVLELVLEPV